MVDVSILLLWLPICTKFSFGLEAFGFSALLSESNSFDVPTDNKQVNIITEWSMVPEYGFYNHDCHTKTDHGYKIVAPLEGIYFLSANIVIETLRNTKVEAFFQEKQQPRKQYCTAIEDLANEITITITLSCFTRLKFLTELQLGLKNSDQVVVKSGSTVAFQSIGASGIVPSLVLPLAAADTSLQENIKNSNEEDSAFKFFNSLTVIREPNVINIPCTGTYIISLSLSLAQENIQSDSTLQVTINGDVIFSLPKTTNPAWWNKQFLNVFNLQQNDEIEIKYDNIYLDEHSTYAIIRTWDNAQDSGSVNIPLKDPVETRDDGIMFQLSDSDGINNSKNITQNQFKFNSPTKNFLTANSYGLFLISLDLEIQGDEEILDFYIGIRISQETDYLDTDVDSCLNSQVKGSVNKARTIKIAGMLEIRADSFISVAIHSSNKFSFTAKDKLKGSLVISKMQLNTLAATMSLKQSSTKNIQCKNHAFKYDIKLSNKFHLNKYISLEDASFKAPDDAVYLVHVYGTLQLIQSYAVNFTLSIKQSRNNDIVADMKEFVFPSQKAEQLLFVRLVTMETGDLIRFMTSCEKNVKILDSLKVSIIYVQPLSASNHMIVRPLRKQETHTIKLPGVYYVIFRVTFKVSKLKNVTTMEIKVNKEDKTLLNEQKSLDPKVNSEISGGLVTVSTFGFLYFDKNDKIQTEVSCLSCDVSSADGIQSIGYIMDKNFEYIIITDPNRVTYGFRAVQFSSKLFNFANKMTTPNNFQLSSSGGFRLEQTQLFGPNFIVPKPMTMLYIASVRLVDVVGKFHLSVNIRPRRGMIRITSPLEVKAKETITLKASGLLSFGVGESVEFVVNGFTQEKLVLCSSSLWSLIEITTPSPQFYGMIDSKKQTTLDTETFLFLSRNTDQYNRLQISKNDDQKPQEFYAIQRTEHVVGAISSKKDQSGFVGVNFNLLSKNNNSTDCQVILMEVTQGMNELYFNSVDNKLWSLNVNKQDLLLICLKNDDKLSIPSGFTGISIAEDDNSITPLSYTKLATSIEAFSAILMNDQEMTVVENIPQIINRWRANTPPFFDQSEGYRDGKGMYVVTVNGFYLIMVNLNIDRKNFKSCNLHIQIDDQIKVSRAITPQTVHNNVIWLQKDSVLLLMIGCHANSTLKLKSMSTFSIVQTDTRVSLPLECLETDLLLSVDEEVVFTQVETPYNVTCHHNRYLIGDFIWKKNGNVVMTSFGQREATIYFQLLRMEDNGKYECVMERGKQETFSKKVEIVVIDPRPKLQLSSSDISIEENTMYNPMVAWAQVQAYNLTTNKIAPVRLSIVEGDPAKLFYFEPENAMFVSSFKFKKPLDYELQQTYQLTIQAENTEFDGQLGKVTQEMLVRVINRNEHKPQFTNGIKKVNISENIKNNTMIAKFSATDFDLDNVTKLTYCLMDTPNNGLFRIDESTGELFTASIIDYELVQEVILIVFVNDGIHTEYTDVKILIKNSNDNQPRFTQDKYRANITNSIPPGSHILSLKASDKDNAGANRVLSYRIVSGNEKGYFGLSSDSLVAVKTPEAGEKFELTVEAYDEEGKLSTNTATVFINVTRSQSHHMTRIFKEMFYNEDLNENAAINSFVFQTELATISKYNFEYSLKEFGNIDIEYFRITKDGTLVVANSIDYEQKKEHHVAIKACIISTKLKKDELCDLCHLTINIVDRNDNPPKLEKEKFIYKIREDLEPKSVIATLQADDADEQNMGVFSFYLHPPMDDFSVGIKSGELVLEKKLNYTLQSSYKFNVEVRDGGSPSLVGSSIIMINILQFNTTNGTAVLFDSTLGGEMAHSYWKYTIPICLIIVMLFLFLVLLLLLYKYNRSTKKLTEYEINKPKTEMKSLLTYFKTPGESMEVSMNFSCESIPDAYNKNRHANGNLSKPHSSPV